MVHLAYCVSVVWIVTYYHQGQYSRAYRLGCIAHERIIKYHPGVNVFRTIDQLKGDKLYPKHCKFRNTVAYFLKKLRKNRCRL